MKHFKTYEAYKLGVNGVGSLRNSLTALKRQNINGRYVDPEILAKGIRNEYEAITGEKYEDEVQMSMDNTIADIIGHFKLDGPDFMAAWDKVIKESVNEALSREALKRMDGLHSYRDLDKALKIIDKIYGELYEEGFEADEIMEFLKMKINKQLGGSAFESKLNKVDEAISITEGTDISSWNQAGLKGVDNAQITTFAGPKDVESFGLGRKCMQINIGRNYVQLNPADIVELKDLFKSYKVK